MEQGLLPVNPAAYRRQEMVQREKAVLKQRKKLVNAKCLTLSDLVTDLGDYLFPCYALHGRWPQVGGIYALILEIVNALSLPSCLLCDSSHSFDDWRPIRARDRKKSQRR